MDKKEIRRLKREAREERTYGNHILKKIVGYDPQVAWIYDQYKNEKQQAQIGGILKWTMLVLGISSFILSCIAVAHGIPQDFLPSSIGVGLALCWWNYQQIHQTRAEMFYRDIVNFADYGAKTKAYESMEGQKNGTDKTTTVD